MTEEEEERARKMREVRGTYLDQRMSDRILLTQILQQSPMGLTFDELVKEYRSIFPRWRVNWVAEHLIDAMGFPYKPSPERYFLDKKQEGLKEKDHLGFLSYFLDWQYANGKYYSSKLGNRGIAIATAREAVRATLAGQLSQYCEKRQLTNFEFLRMFAQGMAVLEARGMGWHAGLGKWHGYENSTLQYV